MLILFIFYSLLQCIVGRVLFRKLFDGAPKLLETVGSFLLGVFVGIPITYVFSCLFAFTGEPMLWGMVATVALAIVAGIKYKVFSIKYAFLKNEHKGSLSPARLDPNTSESERAHCHLSDVLLLLFSLIFSAWLMMKTFRGGVGGELFVGSNNVFDFGHSLGLIRSMSWGTNIPLTSPFFAGLPFFYHFLFLFWVSLWEYAGIPIVLAVNIPSILSFSALLIIIYYLPQILFKKGKLVGWLAVLLTITHSTMTFWHLLIEKGLNIKLITDIWRLPTYPFAGPFDGSTISIVMTLNNFVNQRHLAFSIALSLLLYMFLVQTIEKSKLSMRNICVLGIFTGSVLLWNIATCILIGMVMISMLFLKKRWKEMIVFGLFFVIAVIISFIPFYSFIYHAYDLFVTKGVSQMLGQSKPAWTLWEYLWQNMSILPVIVIFGWIVLPKNKKVYAFPFIFLFVLSYIYANVGKHGFDQKFYSFLIIGVNVVAAIGIAFLWEKKLFVYRMLACIVLFIVTISGAVDLMAIKNEFAYPLINKEIALVISWIRDNTAKNAVFVSYSDIIDPVVLAGRKNYFGFFGNVGWTDRSPNVKNIYAGDIQIAQKLGISYILVPNWKKSDFPYVVDTMYFKEHRMAVYEDEKYTILDMRQ